MEEVSSLHRKMARTQEITSIIKKKQESTGGNRVYIYTEEKENLSKNLRCSRVPKTNHPFMSPLLYELVTNPINLWFSV